MNTMEAADQKLTTWQMCVNIVTIVTILLCLLSVLLAALAGTVGVVTIVVGIMRWMFGWGVSDWDASRIVIATTACWFYVGVAFILERRYG